MNCEDCRTITQVKKRQQVALSYIQGSAEMTEVERKMAINCLECAADKLAREARKRLGDPS